MRAFCQEQELELQLRIIELAEQQQRQVLEEQKLDALLRQQVGRGSSPHRGVGVLAGCAGCFPDPAEFGTRHGHCSTEMSQRGSSVSQRVEPANSIFCRFGLSPPQ